MKETLYDVDFCVIFIAFKLAGSACWFYYGHSRFIRERERERETELNWNMIFYDVYLTQSKTTWLDSADSAGHWHNLFKQFATCVCTTSICHASPRPIATQFRVFLAHSLAAFYWRILWRHSTGTATTALLVFIALPNKHFKMTFSGN